MFAVPGDITRLNSRGANGLIAAGARLVQRPADALYELKDQLRGYLREETLEAVEETAAWLPPRKRRSAPAREPDGGAGEGADEGAGEGVAASELESGASDASAAPAATVAVKAAAASAPRPSLSDQERVVYDLIRHEPRYLDTLISELDPDQFPINRLSAVLLGLELKKVIRQLPGRLYAVLE